MAEDPLPWHRVEAQRWRSRREPVAAERTCLRCRRPFPSSGPGNRLCFNCTDCVKGVEDLGVHEVP